MKKALAIMLLGYLVLSGINEILFPTLPGFRDINPHPYWIVVIPMAAIYGVFIALVSGLGAAFLYSGITWFQPDKYILEDPSFYSLPATFIMGGILIALGTNKFRKQIHQLTEEKKTLLSNEQAIKNEIQTLYEVNAVLEKRAVTRMSTLINLYEGYRIMDFDQIETLYESIPKFITLTMETPHADLYLKGNDGWDLKSENGLRAKKVAFNNSIIGNAGLQNRVITILDSSTLGFPDRPSENSDDYMMAGPLRMGSSGCVVGVVGIRHLSLFQLNSASLNLFAFLLDWASRAIEKSHFMAQLRANQFFVPNLNICSKNYFFERASQEFDRFTIHDSPLGLGVMRLEGLDTLPHKIQILKIISQLIRQCCGQLDIIALSPYPQAHLAFLLVMATQHQVEMTTRHILTALEQIRNESKGGIFSSLEPRMGWSHCSDDYQCIDEMASAACTRMTY